MNVTDSDRVSPGMTFAVYDPKMGISLAEDAKGKKADPKTVPAAPAQTTTDAKATVAAPPAASAASPERSALVRRNAAASRGRSPCARARPRA